MKAFFDSVIAKLGGYFLFTLILGGLLAPPLFSLGKWAVAEGFMDGTGLAPLQFLHDALERSPFPRYFNRAMLIAALIGLYPLARWMRREGKQGFGLQPNPLAKQDFSIGFLYAAGLLLVMGGTYLLGDLYYVREEIKWGRFPGIIISALVVGLLEEYFFRGAILGLLMRTLKTWKAVLFVTLFYAVVHFLKAPRHVEITPEALRWDSGFHMVGLIFHQFTLPLKVIAEFTTLCAVGGVLAWARLRTGSLWLPIGLHAGWVFGLKSYDRIANDNRQILEQWMPWAGNSLKTGLIPLVVILITAWLIRLWIRRWREPATANPSAA
ncbi:MAG: CPBP family intramembrane glutamic endopeptidase [Verrucomicrobiota bacterium]